MHRRTANSQTQDARILPSVQFGVDAGETHVIRNAGGRTSDAFRSLIISQQLLGTDEIIVIQHTDCGMLTFTNEQAQELISSQLALDENSQETKDLRATDFLPFPNLEANIRNDVQFLKDSRLVKTNKVAGFIVRAASSIPSS